MNISLRKGIAHFSVDYTDGDFSNNLYCSNINYIDGDKKVLVFDFQKLVNSRVRTNSKDDLSDLKGKYNKLSTIYFADEYITKKLVKRLKQNEKVVVKLLVDSVHELEMKIVFKDWGHFNLEKIS